MGECLYQTLTSTTFETAQQPNSLGCSHILGKKWFEWRTKFPLTPKRHAKVGGPLSALKLLQQVRILLLASMILLVMIVMWRFRKSSTLKHTIHDVSFGVSKLMNPAGHGAIRFHRCPLPRSRRPRPKCRPWGWSRKSCAWFSPREIQLHISYRFLYYAKKMWYEMIFEMTRNWYETIGNDMNHMKRYEMAWNDMKWYEMVCLGIPPLNLVR
jgi:hypothetical protein